MPNRSTVARALAYHLGGVAVTVVAAGGAGFAAFLLSFATSTCREPDVRQELLQLRLGLGIIGVVLALVPAGWALLGRSWGRRWQPWALLVLPALAVTASSVASAEVGTFCF